MNFEYACIQGTYWMFYGVVSSFASVFLLAKGCSNSEIGIILAVANILAVVLQPFIADIADRTRRISVIGIAELITVFMMVTTAGMFVFRGGTMALSVVFVLLIAWHTVLQPLFNSLTFKLEESGVHINFGVARSMGSLAYSALVAVLGTLVERNGVMVLPVTGEAILVMMMLSLLFTKRAFDSSKSIRRDNKEPERKEKGARLDESSVGQISPKDDNVRASSQSIDEEETITLMQFIRRNKLFFAVNIGVIGLYFSNSILNNYMMQIVSVVGGDSEDMGRVLSVMAFLEIPTMVFFDKLRSRFSCQLMLKVASVGFTVKIAVCHIANSVGMILFAQVFQLVSFALFLPAMVHFIDEIMDKGEAVKGQALFTTMVTVTTVFSSFAGGFILDMSDAKMLTLIAAIATSAGAAVIIAVVDRVKKNGK